MTKRDHLDEAESLARRRSFFDRDDPEAREAARDLLSREMHEISQAAAAERWAGYAREARRK